MASSLGTEAERRSLRWSGALLVGGFFLNAAVTMLFHPGRPLGARDLRRCSPGQLRRRRRGTASPRRSPSAASGPPCDGTTDSGEVRTRSICPEDEETLKIRLVGNRSVAAPVTPDTPWGYRLQDRGGER